MAACLPPGDFKEADATPEAALVDIWRAITFYKLAVKLAPQSAWRGIESMTHLSLGLAYQLEGQAMIFTGDLQAANTALDLAQRELAGAVQPFGVAERPEYLALTHQGLALAQRLQAHVRFVQKINASNDQDTPLAEANGIAGLTLLKKAQSNVNLCLDQRAKVATKPIFVKYVLDCGCTPLAADIQTTLENEGGTP